VFDLRTEAVVDLREHARIPSVYESATVFEVRQSQAGFELVESAGSRQFRKNYDEFEDPLTWPRDFDTSQWALISAFSGTRRVGGIIAARDTPDVLMSEGRIDLAILWDLRVAPAHRRQGVAAALVHAASEWARSQDCTEIKVETQNTNPAACKFYMENGFALSEVQDRAYPQLPDEVQLIWRKKLGG
jgi:GNAT superfamily N-acetyltransferase